MQFHRFARQCLLATITTACAAQAAGTVWRCGDVYSDRPCEGGRSLEPPPPVSAADARRPREAMQQNQRAADAMQRERLRDQGMAAGPLVMVPPSDSRIAAAGADDDPDPPRRRASAPRKPQVFTATVPGTVKPRGQGAKAQQAQPAHGKETPPKSAADRSHVGPAPARKS